MKTTNKTSMKTTNKTSKLIKLQNKIINDYGGLVNDAFPLPYVLCFFEAL